MERNINRRRFLEISGAAGMAAIAGCAGDGEDTPTDTPEPTTAEPTTEEPTTEEPEADYTPPSEIENALVEPATLKEWVDAGLVNSDDVYADPRVSVIRVDAGNYDSGHVPGAVPLASNDAEGSATLATTRVEGLAQTQKLVPHGETVDQIIQNAGVGPNTTIVLSGDNPMYSARAYWVLRFWGFPRERVKVLQGGSSAYDDEFGLVFEDVETPDSNYTVEAFEEPNYTRRKGLNELIQDVDAINAGEEAPSIIDQRGEGDGEGEAKIAGSHIDQAGAYIDGDSFTAANPWKSASEIEEHVNGYEGVDAANGDIVTMCHSGFKGTIAFFALDGIVGNENVALYDGSWTFSWSQYNGEQDPTPNEAWRTDINERTVGEITDTSQLDIDPDLNADLTELATLEANQVKKDAIEYIVGDTSGGFGCGS
ncbi:rhodanese domain protein [Halodesulfurarchaeum formicicum]|uniref:Rhodanese domain protein n=1 Tax=Halodesulfurarchaeum formicicum TaxID=1873524 RepID=A0A1D8S596_9EURY|nr:selenite/tellurite reduction operon rhodanese-like protein ExtH [Halodesulfurarchaeum formicicum]AOW80524.1 rhodanese domain protein [Halodesulfurarchaeum formicicum]